jgi:transposase
MAYQTRDYIDAAPFYKPDINPIEKYWRRIRQALHRQKKQPTTEAEMEAATQRNRR